MVPQSELDVDLVKTILSEYKIHNADITLRYDATADDLIDVVEGNRTYIPCIYLLNKIDQISIEVRLILYILNSFKFLRLLIIGIGYYLQNSSHCSNLRSS